MSTHNICVKVNGIEHKVEVEGRTLLVHLIREILGLKGTHIGCDTSLCGACTISLNGKAIKSCTLLAVQADGAEIMTVEGLSQNGELHKIQKGFWEEHGLQCGFCTPGLMILCKQLLEENPNPSEQEIRHYIDGNLCRCTGYQHIVNAVVHAVQSEN